MSRARMVLAQLTLVGALLTLVGGLAACGGDDDDEGVGLGPGGKSDAGARDAAADAAQDDPVDANVKPPPTSVDAGRDAGNTTPEPPIDEDDGGAQCNERACRKMGDECNEAHCDKDSDECLLKARANGTSCGSDVLDNCGAPDSCKAGKCVTNDAPKGTACGDQDKDCRKDDACDGHGKCVDKGVAAEGSACGDRVTNTACDKLDTCDDSGECLHNYADVDAPCDDQEQLCRNNDSCDGLGQCIDSGAWLVGQCPMGQSGDNCTCGASSICVGTMCQPSD